MLVKTSAARGPLLVKINSDALDNPGSNPHNIAVLDEQDYFRSQRTPRLFPVEV